MSSCCIVFDLDDSLYKEIEFVKSGYRFIASQLTEKGINASECFEVQYKAYIKGENAFECVNDRFGLDIPLAKYLEWYRFHLPDIKMSDEVKETLSQLKSAGNQLGIITDGREITQMNKIKSLGLLEFIHLDDIVISEKFGSEKPCPSNYLYFMQKHHGVSKYVYIGDNPSKDFIAPNALGWLTIGLRANGQNIHRQDEVTLGKAPKIWILNINELNRVI